MKSSLYTEGQCHNKDVPPKPRMCHQKLHSGTESSSDVPRKCGCAAKNSEQMTDVLQNTWTRNQGSGVITSKSHFPKSSICVRNGLLVLGNQFMRLHFCVSLAFSSPYRESARGSHRWCKISDVVLFFRRSGVPGRFQSRTSHDVGIRGDAP